MEPLEFLLAAGDLLLVWLLVLPRDVVLIVLAVMTAAILVLVRLVTTNQDLLRRCRNDRKRINARIRQLKRRDDAELIDRLAATRNMIALKTLRAEGLPLLASLVPIAVLAVWAFARLGYVPPRAGEPVQVTATFPLSATGRVAHLVPEDGLSCTDGWVKEVQPASNTTPPRASATWTIQAEARPQPYDLVIRFGEGTFRRELLVGQRTYSDPVLFYDSESGVLSAEVRMRPYRPFGVIPGIPWVGFDPWLVGYLLVAIPLVPLLKWALRIG